MSRIVDAIVDHPFIAIVVVLLITGALGAGAPRVDQESSLDQFQTETAAAEKLDFIRENFAVGPENVTTAQLILRDENVLDRESLIRALEYEQRLESNASIGPTLVENRSIIGIPNLVAIAAIRGEQAEELQATVREFQQLNQSIQAERGSIQARSDSLNATAMELRTALDRLAADRNASIDQAFDGVQRNTTIALNQTDAAIFRTAAQRLRNATSQQEAVAAYELGTQGVLVEEYRAVQARAAALQEDATELRALGEQIQAQTEELESETPPTLDAQLAALRELNESELETTITAVLSEDGPGGGEFNAFAFMPGSYEPGTTTAPATMLVVTQHSDTPSVGGAASEEIVDSQLAMRTIGDTMGADLEVLVFGAGVINHEINASMTDSLLVVGPLAILFVLVALTIAYRDPLDIILGVLGIGIVLVWTFGFMGWADIAFNQIFVAVPVLLIGLSIDYAIHIFMRHREERTEGDGLGSRGSMRIALAGVGIALVLVTATTVIGFLSNLTSPVPPIREFGIVSSAGIVAALVVFGVLTPSLKIVLDELFERLGVDRRKRAFATGNSPIGRGLRVGSEAARRFPAIVIALVLLVSLAGAYGATQVDTSFDQADFLAEDPPAWMEELPEPFRPGEFHAKRNLEFVNENFIREDTQAQLLLEGASTSSGTLHRLDAVETELSNADFVARLSTGDTDLTSPLTVLRAVAATNETVNATLASADTDGDGIPEENVAEVFDAVFAAAPDRAGSVIYRSDEGEYRALRLVVSIRGNAESDRVTEEFQGLADDLDGEGVEATATGQVILFEIVQRQLLETVVQSLVVTLVAVLLFLLIIYRIADGSATLGAVTVVPVMLSVSWILGTMYLLDIPFNVLTGMITSLTVGLGVAYSIHLSERFSQELERTPSVWVALERSVTGTGGALLGSAATTVGGFGVLVFAVLPPLQQFGLITGLSIIYAFAASVFVLPSLLVVWTRYVGPDWAERDFRPEVRAAGAGAIGSGSREIGSIAAVPGESVPVTAHVSRGRGRVVLEESASAGSVSLQTADPAPSSVANRDGRLFVVWSDLDRDATVRYDLVLNDVAPGTDIEIDGTVASLVADTAIDGSSTVSVVADVIERAQRTGGVTAADLAVAADLLERDEITVDAYERLYRAWLRDTDPAATPLRAADDE